MQIDKVLQFTDIKVAKQFVVDEMVALWNSDKLTLVVTYVDEPFVEQVINTLYDKSAEAQIGLVQFDSVQDLFAKLDCLAANTYQNIVVFNSFHRLESLTDVDRQLARLLDDHGRLHLSWPAQSILGELDGYSEVDIAQMVSTEIAQPFDTLRKSDQFYLDMFSSFRCQRLSKFDFKLNFISLDGVKSWHEGGADLLFGPGDNKLQEKDEFYTKLFEYDRDGLYQARMTTTVADFCLK